MRWLGLFVFSIFVVAGCHTTPIDRATVFYERSSFLSRIKKDLDLDAAEVLAHRRCALQLTTPGSNQAPSRFCVYFLEKGALNVLKWSAASLSYEREVRLDFSAIRSAGVSSFLGRSVQLQLVEDARLTGFRAVIDDGGYYDNDATNTVYKTILDFGVPLSEASGLIKEPTAGYPVAVPIILHR